MLLHFLRVYLSLILVPVMQIFKWSQDIFISCACIYSEVVFTLCNYSYCLHWLSTYPSTVCS